MDSSVPTRIPPRAFQATTGVLFGVAIIACVGRSYIQFTLHKKFYAEDWILLFAMTVLVGSTVLCFLLFPRLYRALEVTLGSFDVELFEEVIEDIPIESSEANAISTLWWFTIFPVKLAYLLFFRKLIYRLHHLTRYWWFVTGFMIVGLAACVSADWQVCPYVEAGELIAKCAGNDEGVRSVKVTITTTVFDVLSDIFIASIPICLLWRVRISTRQKLGLGMTLCLSLVMAIIAFVRIGGIHLPGGQVDVVWAAFWQQNECSIAVWMVSMTAFRSFFTMERDGHRRDSRFEWLANLCRSFNRRMLKLFTKRFRNRQEDSSSTPYPIYQSDRSGQPFIQSHEPSIPSGTIAGVRTAIDIAGRTHNEPEPPIA